MRIAWYGQSAFRISRAGSPTVLIDPPGDTASFAARGMRFDYPSVAGIEADLLLITHEHADHNGADKVAGDPQIIRSRAGTFESPVGPVVGIASEHDPLAGTERGDNVIFVFDYVGVRICHLGDLGQDGLRPAQVKAIGRPDVLFIPVGDGPTIGGRSAVAVVERLAPAVVIPMHYRTPAIDFLEPIESFLEVADYETERLSSSDWQADLGARSNGSSRIVIPTP